MTEIMSNGKAVEIKELKIKDGIMIQALLTNPDIKIGKLFDSILPLVCNLTLSDIWDLTVADIKKISEKIQELNGLNSMTATVKNILEAVDKNAG